MRLALIRSECGLMKGNCKMTRLFTSTINAAAALLCTSAVVFGSHTGSLASPTYGVAVDGPLSNTVVAPDNQSNITDSSLPNRIDFFIPLADGDNGVFGVDGVGVEQSTFPAGDSGSMDMWLRFAPVRTGNGLLTLDFTDLDLFNVNDPDGFLETLEVLDADGSSLALITDVTHSAVVLADFDEQFIELALSLTSDPFFLRLTLGASLEGKTGKYKNTIESLTANVQYVPVPASLGLMGLGLLGVGAAAVRRRRG